MSMEKFLYDLELELEVLLTSRKPEKRFISVEGNKYTPGGLTEVLKQNYTNEKPLFQ